MTFRKILCVIVISIDCDDETWAFPMPHIILLFVYKHNSQTAIDVGTKCVCLPCNYNHTMSDHSDRVTGQPIKSNALLRYNKIEKVVCQVKESHQIGMLLLEYGLIDNNCLTEADVKSNYNRKSLQLDIQNHHPIEDVLLVWTAYTFLIYPGEASGHIKVCLIDTCINNSWVMQGHVKIGYFVF